MVALPLAVFDLLLGRRLVAFAVIILLLHQLFSYQTRLRGKCQFLLDKFGALLLIPVLLLLVLAFRIFIVFRGNPFSDFFELFSAINFFSAFIPTIENSTEVHSLLGTATFYSHYALILPNSFEFPELSPLLNSFKVLPSFDLPTLINNSSFLFMGGSLPVTHYALLPRLLVPLFLVLSITLPLYLVRHIAFIAYPFLADQVIYTFLVASMPRWLLYNFSFFYRALFLGLLVLFLFRLFLPVKRPFLSELSL